jgi:8-oxo-dGTP pyrophosphatase MutT (NUDIX family)
MNVEPDQAATIPFRRRKDGAVEFCIITSLRDGRWGFPKGTVDPGDTLEETALKESDEEAGLHGRLLGEPLGTYSYVKQVQPLRVVVFLMEVERAAGTWDEADRRTRRWVSAEEARALVAHPEQRRLFEAALERLNDPP